MRITPLDVRKQEFRKAVRGFDCDEVRAFLSTLADEYETVLMDNKQIRERLLEQEQKLTEYLKMERNLRDTLMTAERVTQETRENASRAGDLIVKDAEMKARGILEECRLRTEELRREIIGLRKEKETYLARFRSLAEAQIQFIDTHRSDFEDLDKRLTDIADNVVLHRHASEGSTEADAEAKSTFAPRMVTRATASTPAPVVTEAGGGEDDIWRDYTPGAPSAPESTPNSVTVHNVPAETAAVTPPNEAESADDTNENDINQVLTETLAEVDGKPTSAEEGVAIATETAVALASRGIPVMSGGDGDETEAVDQLVHEVTNI